MAAAARESWQAGRGRSSQAHSTHTRELPSITPTKRVGRRASERTHPHTLRRAGSEGSAIAANCVMVSVSTIVSLLYTSPRSATGTPVTGELPTLPALSVADSYVNLARSLLHMVVVQGAGGGGGGWGQVVSAQAQVGSTTTCGRQQAPHEQSELTGGWPTGTRCPTRPARTSRWLRSGHPSLLQGEGGGVGTCKFKRQQHRDGRRRRRRSRWRRRRRRRRHPPYAGNAAPAAVNDANPAKSKERRASCCCESAELLLLLHCTTLLRLWRWPTNGCRHMAAQESAAAILWTCVWWGGARVPACVRASLSQLQDASWFRVVTSSMQCAKEAQISTFSTHRAQRTAAVAAPLPTLH